MSYFHNHPVIVLFLGLGLILFVLCGVIAWTIRISSRLSKAEPPRIWLLFAIAFLQVLLGGLTVFFIRDFSYDSFVVFGTSLGVIILSGLFFIKLILKNGWRRSLRVWAIAAAMQLVLVPICAVVLAVGWVMLLFWLHPPQF